MCSCASDISLKKRCKYVNVFRQKELSEHFSIKPRDTDKSSVLIRLGFCSKRLIFNTSFIYQILIYCTEKNIENIEECYSILVEFSKNL